MTEIRFYHLERTNMLQALPPLLSKAYENGHRIVVKLANAVDVKALNEHLWSFHPDSFLPHGSEKEGNAALQPIWLTDKDENPNKADVLIITDGSQSAQMKDYTLTCEVFDGRNEQAVSGARERWKAYKDEGLEMTYWQQGEKGWEKKA